MSELALVALGGILGSSHCVGMCGGFALTIGLGARGPARALARQLVYSAGRIFTYSFLGCAAGFAGFWFARRSGALVHAQAALSVAAGVFLVVQGLLSLGLVPRFRARRGSGGPCLLGSFVGPFLASPRWPLVFVAGVLNGLLPCGLVYAYLALASSTASLPGGLATMAAFGLGTVPVMVLTGAGGSALSHVARRRLFRVAAVCVLFTGLVSVARGASFWRSAHGPDAPRCPACADDSGAGFVLTHPAHVLTSPSSGRSAPAPAR
jgi:sulfite exporter TauE/SafE